MSDAIDQMPGDDLLPAASMVIDRRRLIYAPAEAVWPWLMQLGKSRGGWYLPGWLERVLPARWRASRTIKSQYQSLAPGDRVPDYGAAGAWLEVASLDPPRCLIYRAQRGRAVFTWALRLAPTDLGQTEVRLRFRGQFDRGPIAHAAFLRVGALLDWATSELMLRGLAERIEQAVAGAPDPVE